jgi:mannose-6-phosphate isomerase-like protein (cupin superfamily)
VVYRASPRFPRATPPPRTRYVHGAPVRCDREDTETMSAKIVGPRDGKAGDLGSLGVRFMAWASETGGGFSLVEHPIPPRGLAAPLHRHSREDEYSFVLEGRMGADLGGDVVVAGPGDLVFKPRAEWHTFWNAGERAVPDPRDHLPRRVRALLRGADRLPRGADPGERRAGGGEVRPGDRRREHPGAVRAPRAALRARGARLNANGAGSCAPAPFFAAFGAARAPSSGSGRSCTGRRPARRCTRPARA